VQASLCSAGSAAPTELAFERFFREHYRVLVRIADGVLHEAHLAEDVAQEVLIAARRRFGELASWQGDLAGPDRPAGWVRVAVVHAALNELRGRRRRQARQERGGPLPSAAGPEELMLEREEHGELRRALARLPRHSATVLVLRHSGLSYAEVAEAMGVKPAHVGTMLRRAEAALRKEVSRAPRS
jgi:RNA polymerase sigma-70 factor (ECF subfamily)